MSLHKPSASSPGNAEPLNPKQRRPDGAKRLRFRPCVQILEGRLIPSANVIYGSQFAGTTLFSYDIGTNAKTVLFTGSQPIDGLDVSADQRAIYYSAESAGEVRRYDTMTHSDALIANVTDSADERLTPDSRSLLVSSFFGGVIKKIDLSTNAVSTFLTNPQGGSGPEGMVFDAAGYLYAALGTRSSGPDKYLAKIDSSGTIVSRSPGVIDLDGLTFNFTDGRIYGTSRLGGFVYRFDPTTLAPTTIASGLNSPDGITTDAVGNLDVAEQGTNSLLQFAAGTYTKSTLATIAGIDELAPERPSGPHTPPRLTAPADQSGVEGAFGNVNLGSFSDPDSSPYTVYVDWGDGTAHTTFSQTTAGSLGSQPHAYAEEGTKTVTVTVTNSAGQSDSTTFHVAVADAPLTAGTVTPPRVSEGQAFRNVPIFFFRDADANGTASDYTAVVNLGDGHSVTLTGTAGANGQIVAHAGGGFDVQLSYTYAEELTNQPFSVHVTDAGGASIANASAAVSIFVDSTHGLSAPGGLAFDGSGNLYVANFYGNTISKVTPAGAVATFVDNTHGLRDPTGLAFDGSGNLYVANGDNTILKVTPAGAVSTFVDNTHGLNPFGLAFDSSGNLYVANNNGNTISKVTPAGTVSTFVDNTYGLKGPVGLAFDASGNLYVTNINGYMINKVTPAGAVTTFVDNTYGLSNPHGLAFDGSGNLYVANSGSSTILKVTPAGAVSTFVDDTRELGAPAGLAFDGSGNLYVANTYGDTILKVTLAGTVTTFVGRTQGLAIPVGLAFDGSGNLYVASNNGNKILKVTPAGTVSTFVDFNHGLRSPEGLAFDSSGNLYVANGDNTISKVTPAGAVSTFVDDTHGLDVPTGLAFDGSGNLYVANRFGDTISKITPVRVSVADPAVVPAGGFTVTAMALSDSGLQTVATFTDGAGEDLADYSALIDWGDGSDAADGTITFDATSGTYTVQGSHTYADEGSYTITVTMSHDLAPDATVTSMANVVAASVVPTGGYTVTRLENTDTGIQLVATFIDPHGSEDVSQYAAVINWGGPWQDQTQGTIVYDPNQDLFLVLGNYAYPDEGTWTITVTISHRTALDAVTTSTAVIADAPLEPVSGDTIQAIAGQDTGMVEVATFRDTDPGMFEDASDYGALIDWGDGSPPSLGTSTFDPSVGYWRVTGNHTYAQGGTYTITVTIAHDTADDITVLGEADVTDAGGGPTPGARRGTGAPAPASRARAVDNVFLPDQVALLLGDHRLWGSRPAALPLAAGSSVSAALTVSDHSSPPVVERGTDRPAAVSARAARRPAHREDLDRSAPWLRKQNEVDYLGLS